MGNKDNKNKDKNKNKNKNKDVKEKEKEKVIVGLVPEVSEEELDNELEELSNHLIGTTDKTGMPDEKLLLSLHGVGNDKKIQFQLNEKRAKKTLIKFIDNLIQTVIATGEDDMSIDTEEFSAKLSKSLLDSKDVLQYIEKGGDEAEALKAIKSFIKGMDVESIIMERLQLVELPQEIPVMSLVERGEVAEEDEPEEDKAEDITDVLNDALSKHIISEDDLEEDGERVEVTELRVPKTPIERYLGKHDDIILP